MGVEYEPFTMQRADAAPRNTELPVAPSRFRRRMGLLNQLESEINILGLENQVIEQRSLYQEARNLVLSPDMAVFDIQQEPATMQAAYGESSFGQGCLLARRLVEAGVTFVEIELGNWDTHQDNFARTRELCQQMDRSYAQLLEDLKQRGMLERTLVIWMGEFGRSPQIDSNGGRNHWPVHTHAVNVGERSDIRSIQLSTQAVTLKPGGSTTIKVNFERAPGFTKNVTLDVMFQHLGTVYGNSLPKGVTIDAGASKTLITGKANQGQIVLKAAKDAPPVKMQQVSVMANISINFVMKATFSSPPLMVTVTKP